MTRTEQQLDKLRSADRNVRPFYICHRLADAANEMIDQGEYQKFSEHVLKVLSLYLNCRSHLVRTAIENVFIYSLGSRVFRSPMRRKIMDIVPERFRAILTNQIIASGI